MNFALPQQVRPKHWLCGGSPSAGRFAYSYLKVWCCYGFRGSVSEGIGCFMLYPQDGGIANYRSVWASYALWVVLFPCIKKAAPAQGCRLYLHRHKWITDREFRVEATENKSVPQGAQLARTLQSIILNNIVVRYSYSHSDKSKETSARFIGRALVLWKPLRPFRFCVAQAAAVRT